MKKILIAFCLIFISLQVHAEAWVNVAHVIDGDTFISTDGEKIRLLDINTPELAKKSRPSEPFSRKAKEHLQKLLAQKQVKLTFGKKTHDRYKRLLAHVYLNDNTWVNGEMVKEGLAHVYTFPDNRFMADELLKLENSARKEKKGIWSHERWQILKAQKPFSDKTIGKFHLVSGKVLHSSKVKDRTYLNFGKNWRTDFTVEIPDKYNHLFEEKGISTVSDYTNKTLLVRGVIKPVNGTLITATHPEQLTILD